LKPPALPGDTYTLGPPRTGRPFHLAAGLADWAGWVGGRAGYPLGPPWPVAPAMGCGSGRLFTAVIRLDFTLRGRRKFEFDSSARASGCLVQVLLIQRDPAHPRLKQFVRSGMLQRLCCFAGILLHRCSPDQRRPIFSVESVCRSEARASSIQIRNHPRWGQGGLGVPGWSRGLDPEKAPKPNDIRGFWRPRPEL